MLNVANEKLKASVAARNVKKIEAQRKSLEGKPVAPLTDENKSAALKNTSEIINFLASDMALVVRGTTAIKDLFWSVNFGSVWPGNTDDDYKFVAKNENISHIHHTQRLFFQSKTTGVGLKLGQEYTMLEFKLSEVANLASLKSKFCDVLKQSREADRVLVATFQLIAPSGYEDAKYVEEQGFNKLRENDEIIPMEDTAAYHEGSTSSKTDRGVITLTVVLDVCKGVNDGKVLFCATSSTQAFMNTVKSIVPCASPSGWGILGQPDETLATMNNSLDVKPAAAATKRSGSGALRDLDPNTAVPPPPKRMRRPTPEQLKGMIVVKSGTTTMQTKELVEMFDSFDEAEFRTNFPAINGSNKERVILVVGKSSNESRSKVTKAQELGVRIINEEVFMQMLVS